MAKKDAKQTAEQIDRIAGKVIAKSSPNGSQYGTVALGEDRTAQGQTVVSRSQGYGGPGFMNKPSAHVAQGAGSFTQRRDVFASPSSSEPVTATHYGASGNIPRDHKMPEGDVRGFAAQTFRKIRSAQRGGAGAGRGDDPHFDFRPM